MELNKYLVNKEKLERVFENRIKNQFTKNVTSVEQPKAFIIGGQPAAGKTGVFEQVLQQEQNNVVFVNLDEMDKLHPSYKQVKEAGLNVALTLREDSGALMRMLIAECVKYKYNFVMETGFGDVSSLPIMVERLKSNDFKVFMIILTVRSEISILGIHQRFEKGLEKGEGRYVPVEQHNSRYKSIPEKLDFIVKNTLFNGYVIAEGRLVGGKDAYALKSVSVNDVIKEYLSIRYRPFNKIEAHIFALSCSDMCTEIIKRGGDVKHFISDLKSMSGDDLNKKPLFY